MVALHANGWSAKAIARYLQVGKSTVYGCSRGGSRRASRVWRTDRPHGRPPGVHKVTLKAMEAIRRFQQNPNLGKFRIHAALAQIGNSRAPLSAPRTSPPTYPS